MPVAQTMQRLCSVKRSPVAAEVRRRELGELAAVVGSSLLVQAFALPPIREGGSWAHMVLLVALPWAAAWTLRRTAGRQALAAAAILSLGLLGGLLIVAPQDWARAMTTNAYVSVAMVWILCTDRRASATTVAVGAAVMAAAIAIASLI